MAAIRDYLGSFDYTSGSGKKSRQFNFAVDVTAPEPIKLQEHDAYAWTALTEESPVTKDGLSALVEAGQSASRRYLRPAPRGGLDWPPTKPAPP